MINTIEKTLGFLPPTVRETIFLRLWSWMNVRLISYCKPRVIESNDDVVKVLIPTNRRTRNHLHSMYFGALAVGADVAGGLIAMRTIKAKNANVSLVFKDFQAEFLKRPEGDVVFTCADGKAVRETVEKTLKSKERENVSVRVIATVPSLSREEPVATFTLTLSLKARS